MCKEKPENLVNDAVLNGKASMISNSKCWKHEPENGTTENMNQKMESLRTEVNQLKFKVDPLLTSENVVDELRNNKLSLVKENSELRKKMLNLSLTTSDLKTKVKDLEHERDSLITAPKLQQQDIEQNRTTTQKRIAEWKTTSAPKNKDNQASATLNFHNNFDTLDDEVGEENGGTAKLFHAGTNNIPSQSVDECINDIEKLIVGLKEKFPNSKIGISGITTRQEIDSTSKVNEVNEKIKAISLKHSVKFIDNSSLDETSLNSSKLHLNSKGTAIFNLFLQLH
ncbi:Hypothetical predicted protein [Paramuricea clavata]|uniref:Uncharacterized protein n=1 Tax=Paramuricea clavata TaxID=317549 RepID=A0A7D9DX06_PARCT|nr:Hypothetical predicted protein [Paramuricea clavata]